MKPPESRGLVQEMPCVVTPGRLGYNGNYFLLLSVIYRAGVHKLPAHKEAHGVEEGSTSGVEL